MRTVEECYEYVIARRNELALQRCKRRAVMLKTVAPVCGIAVIAGIAAISKNEEIPSGKYIYSSESSVTGSESSNNAISSAQDPITNSSVGTPKYDNTLNIGEIEIAEGGLSYLYYIPSLFEMNRDEVLEHFGLSTDFELSGVVPELYETMPKNGVLNFDGKHGLHRMCCVYENGDCVWEEVLPMWDNDEFRFENANGSQSAEVIFQRKYSNEVIPWLRSKISIALEDGSFSTKPFYELSPSNVAGVEMRIAKRSIGGYYSEFSTDSLCVGLITEGLSEEKTIAILEYLAEYVGTANSLKNNDINVEECKVSFPAFLF